MAAAAAAAAAAEMLSFEYMSEAQLRQWVEANPGRVNDRDSKCYTPLSAAAVREHSLSLFVWLLDEKGADVNATTVHGYTPLHCRRLDGPWCGPYADKQCWGLLLYGVRKV